MADGERKDKHLREVDKLYKVRKPIKSLSVGRPRGYTIYKGYRKSLVREIQDSLRSSVVVLFCRSELMAEKSIK